MRTVVGTVRKGVEVEVPARDIVWRLGSGGRPAEIKAGA